MRAAIVLLSDFTVQNFTRRIVVELNLRHQIEFVASILPSHVSLKQPFAFEDLDRLDAYVKNLAEQVPPFEIRLDRFYTDEWPGGGILGLNVVETPRLRGLHNRLNQELSQIFTDTRADFDGDEYRFHLTIEMGKVNGFNPYRDYYDSLPNKKVNLAFLCRELAVFYYAEYPLPTRSYITYQVLPLMGKD